MIQYRLVEILCQRKFQQVYFYQSVIAELHPPTYGI